MLRWILALYALALGAPVLGAAVAAANLTLVEPCTGHGVEQVALGPDGRPVEQAPPGGHGAGHDCAACFMDCAQPGLGRGLADAVVQPWPTTVGDPASGRAAAAVAPRLVARAPLPGRRPPARS